MSVRQIPKRYMASDIAVRKPSDGAMGGTFEETPGYIKGVYFEPQTVVQGSESVLTDGTTGKLWVDAVNSDGAFEIPVGSLVSIDGGDWCAVKSVTPFSVSGRVHHWEVEVR